MSPLSFMKSGDQVLVSRIGGPQATKPLLTNLGFVPGAMVDVVHGFGGDMIVQVANTRLAVTREMASKILVQ